MAAFVSRYATAFADVVTAAKLDTAAIDAQLTDFLATWEGSPELRQFFENPAVPAKHKVEFLDSLNATLKLQKELRNLIAILISIAMTSFMSSAARQKFGSKASATCRLWRAHS